MILRFQKIDTLMKKQLVLQQIVNTSRSVQPVIEALSSGRVPYRSLFPREVVLDSHFHLILHM
jgi:hypothetical protein